MINYPYHVEFCTLAVFSNTSIQSIHHLVENINETDIQRRAEELVLDEPLVFRHKCCSKRLRLCGIALFAKARAMVASQYVSNIHELTLRGSILSTAIATLMRVLRPHEKHVNSISGKSFGGGVHQTLTHVAWGKVMDWTMTHLIATFGSLPTYRCADIGCGMNLPAWIGCIYDSRLSFIGLEIDPNRLLLAAEIAITVMPALNELLQRHPHVGLLYADATEYPLGL